MGNAYAGIGSNSESPVRDSKRKARGRGARDRKENGKDASLGKQKSIETSGEVTVVEPFGRKRIPVEEAFAELHKDPKYMAEYNTLEGHYMLAEEFIKARGKMTQEELAIALGTKQTAVSRMESERANPSFKTLERYAKATNTRLVIRFEPIQQEE
jgi:DNA-binding XRE family transcriptional regulator